MPGVFEGGDLRFGLDAGFVFEQDVVIAVGIERRIEIDEIDRFVLDIVAQNL